MGSAVRKDYDKGGGCCCWRCSIHDVVEPQEPPIRFCLHCVHRSTLPLLLLLCILRPGSRGREAASASRCLATSRSAPQLVVAVPTARAAEDLVSRHELQEQGGVRLGE
jgi:hypothetical protein